MVVADDVDVVAGSQLLLFSEISRRYNAVGGHRSGSNNSGAEDYLGRKTIQTADDAHNN